MKKMNLFRKINAISWTIIFVTIMILAYKNWSLNGDYTLLSFVLSLIIYGGFCLCIGYLIDERIRKYFDK